MPEFIYTQDDVDQLKQQWESDLFEKKTDDTLRMVVRRLDESNGYKATIGKDVREAREQITQLKTQFEDFQTARLEEKQNKVQAEEKHRQWYQDRWMRAGIAAGIASVLGVNDLVTNVVHRLFG